MPPLFINCIRIVPGKVSVSHDLRAPLRSIDGFSSALLEEYAEKLEGEGKDFLTRIRKASQRMGQLIDDILKLSRLTRGELNMEDVDLSALAKELLAELKESEPGRDVGFKITEGAVVKGDTILLRAVMENLMANAWKFTTRTDPAKIEFGRKELSGSTVYFVADNGAGFNPAYKSKLFGAFQRLHKADEFPGTGIGLATVQRIVHRHNGKVWAEGEEGKGATFYFTISG